MRGNVQHTELVPFSFVCFIKSHTELHPIPVLPPDLGTVPNPHYMQLPYCPLLPHHTPALLPATRRHPSCSTVAPRCSALLLAATRSFSPQLAAPRHKSLLLAPPRRISVRLAAPRRNLPQLAPPRRNSLLLAATRSRPLPAMQAITDHQETKKKIERLEQAMRESLMASSKHLKRLNRRQARAHILV